MDILIISDEKEASFVSKLKGLFPSSKLKFVSSTNHSFPKSYVVIYIGSEPENNVTNYFVTCKSSIVVGFIFGHLQVKSKIFDYFDHIFLTNKTYAEILQRRLGTRYVHFYDHIKVDTLYGLENLLTWDIKRKSPYNIPDQKMIYRMVLKYMNSFSLDEENAFKAADMACFQITNIFGCKYVNTFKKKLMENQNNLERCINDTILEEEKQIFLPKININYVNQEGFNGVHRWGWQGVLQIISQFSSPSGILFDTFIDKTFTWCKPTTRELGYIPYTVSWMGILHHPFDETYTKDNAKAILDTKEFVDSLPTCKMIICFSEDLASKVRKYVRESHFIDLPIISLYHPGEVIFEENMFSSQKFAAFQKIVQIGSWMRNPFSIYLLNVPHGYKKCALKGNGMNNIFPPDNFITTIEMIDKYKEEKNVWIKYCLKYIKENNYLKNIFGEINEKKINTWIKEKISSVEVINKLNDKDYDFLLSSSIVFLDLIDCSASNTVIECIVRKTPIFVNKLNPLIEYLGEKYPLFYNNFDEISDLLEKTDLNMVSEFLSKRSFYVSPTKFIQDFKLKIFEHL